MWIFTTREIAVFIYAIILLVCVLVRKKGKAILLPVIKAACHIKLIVPFLFVLSFAAIFVLLCTYLTCLHPALSSRPCSFLPRAWGSLGFSSSNGEGNIHLDETVKLYVNG